MYSVITWSRYLILATDIEISFHYKYINFVSWGFFNTPTRIFHHLFYLHKLLLSFIYLHKLYTAFFYLHKLPTEFFLPPPTSTDFFSSTNFLLSFFLHKLLLILLPPQTFYWVFSSTNCLLISLPPQTFYWVCCVGFSSFSALHWPCSPAKEYS